MGMSSEDSTGSKVRVGCVQKNKAALGLLMRVWEKEEKDRTKKGA